jgi:hypothetical protein
MAREHDSPIPGDAALYRRIPWDGGRVDWSDPENPIPSKSNFQDSEDELSLYIAAETTPERALAGHEGFGLISITFNQIQAICQEDGQPVVTIRRDETDPADGHVLVCGRVTKGMAKRLQHTQWEWVVRPRRPPAEE